MRVRSVQKLNIHGYFNELRVTLTGILHCRDKSANRTTTNSHKIAPLSSVNLRERLITSMFNDEQSPLINYLR